MINPTDFVIIIASILVAMTVHEFMHAYVAYRLGDDTAKDEGRISLNPLKHIDPVMTVLLPALAWALFGFIILAAKPVPFNPHRVKYGDYGAAMIAAAGPVSNLLLAIVGTLLLRAFGAADGIGHILGIFIQLNVSLFVFNLLPLPPLDGSRVLYAFAPDPVRDFMNRIEPFGFVIILFLVFGAGLGRVIGSLNESILNTLQLIL